MSTPCATSPCPTLRSAILAAQSGDTIDLTSLRGTIDLTGTLTISNGITIEGPGANLLTISGGGSMQILSVSGASINVTLHGLTFENGNSSGNGGAIEFDSSGGGLTVEACAFTGNRAPGGDGGAIDNEAGTLAVTGSTLGGNSAGGIGGAIDSEGALSVVNGTFFRNSATGTGGAINSDTASAQGLTVVDSTFYDNSSGQGGAIDNEAGTLTVTGSTFSGNSVDGNGGAIDSEGALSVFNCTFSRNSASDDGGAITNDDTLTVTNTIFSGNSADADAGIDFEGTGNRTESYNLFYGNTGGDADFALDSTDLSSSTSGKKANFNPMLLPLGDYGGPVKTMMPEPGSAAICAGNAADVPDGVTTDQRGFPLSPSSCPSGHVDIGSVQTNYVLVNAQANKNGNCNVLSCTLSQAVLLAGTQNYTDIGFDPSLGSPTITLSSTLDLTQGNTVVIGPPDAATISGGGSVQILSVSGSSTNVTLYGLTFENGNSSGNGGAIEFDSSGGGLTVEACTFTGNQAPDGDGGAIDNEAGTLAVTGSTFGGNSTGGDGGTIDSEGALSVVNSTFSSNAASGDGGAINAGTVTVTNSTFSGNSATGDGGAIASDDTLTVTDNIFSGNSADMDGGIDYEGSSNSNLTESYNLFYESTGGDADFGYGTGDVSGTTANPDLAPLDNYGGLTETLLPRPDSAAICAGTTTLPSPLVLPTTDQRGLPRTIVSGSTTCIDIGSVETDYQAPTAEVTDYLNSLYSDGVLNNGRRISLAQEMEKANELAGKGNIQAAINKINHFVKKVNHLLSTGVLTSEQANELLGFANVALESFPSQ